MHNTLVFIAVSHDYVAMTPDHTQLSDQTHLARLEHLLNTLPHGQSAMSLTFFHGILTSLICGPRQMKTPECLHLMFDQAMFTDTENSNEVLELAGKLHADIENGLTHTGEYRPVLEYVKTEDEKTRIDAQRWCLGFVQGLNLTQELWTNDAKSRLSVPLQVVFELAQTRGTGDPAYQEMCGTLPNIAQATYDYWQSEV